MDNLGSLGVSYGSTIQYLYLKIHKQTHDDESYQEQLYSIEMQTYVDITIKDGMSFSTTGAATIKHGSIGILYIDNSELSTPIIIR